MPVVVRRLMHDDHEQWLALWRGYQTFYEVDIPHATTEVTWERLLDDREPMFGALALDSNVVVGIVHWILHRSCWTVGDNCYLQDLFVAEDERGKGIGRALIEHVHQAARAAGCDHVYWLTHETNAEAMLLYDRIASRSGFVQYEMAVK
jgi:GNAT superfamily N-acetyltransferase